MSASSSSANGRSQFWRTLLIVFIASVAFSTFFKREVKNANTGGVGTPFPAIEVNGWLGGKQGPTQQELAGKVYVVDAWAHWCGPCRAAVPHLIKSYEKYKDRGVQFIGVTNEGLDQQSLEMSQKYVELLKIPYPNGYGAENMFDKLHVEGIPQLWVVDREGLIAFHEEGWGGSTYSIEQAIEKALDKPAPAPATAATTPADSVDASKESAVTEPVETKEAPSK